MSKARRVGVELLVCCGIAALWYASRLPPDSANARDPFWPSLLFGIMAAGPLWIPYRVIRLAIGR